MSKKIHFLGFIICCLILFSSCEAEPYEGIIPESEAPPSNPEDPSDPTDPEDPTDPGDPTSGGLYFPLAMDNSWTYTEDFSSPTSFVPAEDPMEITGTVSVDGMDYFLIPAFFAPNTESMELPEGMDLTMEIEGGASIRHEDGNYYQVTEVVSSYEMMGQNFTQTINIDSFLFLKENAEVGATWTETVDLTMSTEMAEIPSQTITEAASYTFVILEKDVTATVNGQTFENVIKISMSDSETDNEIWFARDIGPIYLYNEISATDWYERSIESYTVN